MDGTLTVPSSGTASGLLLRPWTEQDIPAMVAAHRDPVMRRWLGHAVTTDEQAHERIDAHRAGRRAGTGFAFAIVQSDRDGTAGEVVGSVSIRRPDREAASGAVGYWVVVCARAGHRAAGPQRGVRVGLPPTLAPASGTTRTYPRCRQPRVLPRSKQGRLHSVRGATAPAARVPRRRAPPRQDA